MCKIARKVAAPAGIGAGNEAGELAQARVAPVEVEMHRHLAQGGSGADTGLHAHHAGLFLVEAYVGARGLAAQPDAPLAGVRLPE